MLPSAPAFHYRHLTNRISRSCVHRNKVMCMIVLTVCYESGIALDDAYYYGTHMPMVEKLRPHGLRSSEARKILGTPMGNAAPYQLITSLYFDDAAALATAMGSEVGRKLAADVPNFYQGEPDFMIGEVPA